MATSDEAIFLLTDSGNLERVPMRPYDSEDLLQALIAEHPELLAGDQINPDEPVRWLMIKREAGVPGGEQQGDRWSTDHLLLDQSAIPTFVETKRSSDTRIRREVVGQMLDYAANAQRYWPADRIRSMTVIQHGGPEAAEAAMMKLLSLESAESVRTEIEAYWAKVEENLHDGRVRLIFLADRLPAELRRTIEFLNDQMDRAEVLGIELVQYAGSNIKALVPRLIGQTEVIRQKKQPSGISKPRLNLETFLDRCPEETRDFFSKAITESQARGMVVYWGTSGFSLRAPDHTGKLITVFYGFPSGGPGSDSAVIQGYLGNIEDTGYREQLRQRFLSIPGVTQGGEYTMSMDLQAQHFDNAKKLLQLVWDISAELSTISPQGKDVK
jgi:hypothetical protein